VYAVLHSFIFPHLQNILEAADAKLENGVRAYNSKSELLDAIPGATTRGLGNIDLSRCSDQLAYMSDKNVPHEKITCIDEVYSELQKCVAEAGSQSLEGSAEITGDDVLSLFILTVYGSNLEQKLAHVAHVEMYLQSASGRSGGSANLERQDMRYLPCRQLSNSFWKSDVLALHLVHHHGQSPASSPSTCNPAANLTLALRLSRDLSGRQGHSDEHPTP